MPRPAQAHLFFVTVHPFDDGNGRIARAITELGLARSERSPQRFYSLSAQIRQERADYYRVLEQTQRGSLDVTPWVVWFLECLTRAVQSAEHELAGVLARARFWERLREVTLNERQRLMINRLLEGFEGKLTSSKWATMAKSFAGLGAEGHPATCRPRRAREGCSRRAEHELFAGRRGFPRVQLRPLSAT